MLHWYPATCLCPLAVQPLASSVAVMVWQMVGVQSVHMTASTWCGYITHTLSNRDIKYVGKGFKLLFPACHVDFLDVFAQPVDGGVLMLHHLAMSECSCVTNKRNEKHLCADECN